MRWFLVAPFVAFAIPVSAQQLSSYPVLNHGRLAGEMSVRRSGDTVVVRYIYVDRNRGQRIEARYAMGDGTRPQAGQLRPLDQAGVPGEPTVRYELGRDGYVWAARGGRGAMQGEERAGTAPSSVGTFFVMGGTPYDDWLLARHLLAQPAWRAPLLPSGTARLEIAAETTLVVGGRQLRARLAMIHGRGPVPSAVWLDGDGNFLATGVAWFITVRPGAEAVLPALRSLEVRYRNSAAEELARSLDRRVRYPLAIVNGDVFDSETGRVRPRTTVLVDGERILAVGPSDSLKAPPGATVIDASAKTVLPGLWDMHGHLQLTSQSSGSLLQLATGITTVRDLASDLDIAVSHRDRAERGLIVSPRSILAGFIEGPGAWAGPSDVLVRTEEEARSWVARYDSLGYRQIKLYNLIHPDLVPVIASEARRRGLRLSGHIPRGLSVRAAVELGFDEINHAAFLFSDFFQDSLFVPSMRAYSTVASAVAPSIDVDGPGMTALLEFLRRKGTVIDGTFNIWVGAGALGGQPGSTGAKYMRLIKRLYDMGITLVPGTDNASSATYNLELELYELAGIPAPAVLQMATLGAARVMGEERDFGSIAPGKVADIVLVNGRPYEKVSELRNVELVVRAGRVYDPAQLRSVVSGTR